MIARISKSTISQIKMLYDSKGKTMTINGASYQVDIIGKNHDTNTPEPESVEPQEQISEEDTTLDMLADHEYRLCMMELGAE